MNRTDAIIIAGDLPLEVLGKNERDRVRLTVDGNQASLSFLRAYFDCRRDAGKARDRLDGEQRSFLALNGPYLQQFLEARGLQTVLLPFFTPARRELRRMLETEPRPRAVVISTTFFPFAEQVDAIAAFVKRTAPGITVIAGGIHVWKSHLHNCLLEQGAIGEDIRAAVAEHNYFLDPGRPSAVDLLVVSESGEDVLATVLEALRDGKEPGSLDNVAVQTDGQWRINRVSAAPVREVRVDWGRFLQEPTDSFVPVQAGVGCGFRCEFCDFHGIRPVQRRAADSVLAEIRSIPARNGVRRVYFTDDNLFPNRARIVELCGKLARSRLGVRWRGLARIDCVDEETADLMAESGCVEVLLGLESGDAEILKRMHKRVSPEQILAGVELLAARGINTKSTFIIGFPGETESTLANTVSLLNAFPVDGPSVHRYLFFTFAVLPLSRTASPAARARYGLEGYGYHWRHATMDSAGAVRAMATVQDALRPELSPSYVLEVPELPGLDVEDLKRVYVLRNRIVRTRRGLLADEPEPVLWDKLERVFHPGKAPIKPRQSRARLRGEAGSSGARYAGA